MRGQSAVTADMGACGRTGKSAKACLAGVKAHDAAPLLRVCGVVGLVGFQVKPAREVK